MTTGESALVVTGPPISDTGRPGYTPRSVSNPGVSSPKVASRRWVTVGGTSARVSYTSSTTSSAVRP